MDEKLFNGCHESWVCWQCHDASCVYIVYINCVVTGVALILFWGRFFLPIPYRVPIVGIMAKPIDVPKKECPTQEEIEFYHNKLIEEMINLFDRHKAKYGWENKKLIVR